MPYIRKTLPDDIACSAPAALCEASGYGAGPSNDEPENLTAFHQALMEHSAETTMHLRSKYIAGSGRALNRAPRASGLLFDSLTDSVLAVQDLATAPRASR